MPRIPSADPITFLVRRRFPDAHAIRTMPSVISGPSQIDREYRARRRAEIEAYEKELSEKSHDELTRLHEEELQRERDEWAEKARREEEQRFFNQPYAKADFDYWGKVPYWSIEEALALSFGRNPSSVNWESIKGHAGHSPFVADYSRQRTILQRAVGIGQLSEGNLPGFFLGWAKRNRFAYPPDLEAAVVAHGHQVGDWKTLYDEMKKQHEESEAEHKRRSEAQAKKYDELLSSQNAQADRLVAAANQLIVQRDDAAKERDSLRTERDRLALDAAESRGQLEQALATAEKPLHPSIRKSLLKLVLGMAIDKYQFKVDAAKSSATQHIADALMRRGIRLDVDTVRARLQDAVAEVEVETEKSA